MKTLNFYKLILLLSVAVFVSSCVQDDDFETPDTTVVAPVIDGQVLELNALNSLFEQAVVQAAADQGVDPDDFFFDQVVAELRNTLTLPFETDANLYTSGYVITNDESGNFFEEIVIQNAPSNPNRGLKVLIDVNPLSTSLEFGRKVFVKLDGLVIGRNSGVLTIGALNGIRIDKIAESSFEDVLLRDVVVETITPKPLAFADFSFDNTNLFINLMDVQFNRDEIFPNPKTFAGEPTDEFDGERLLESCVGGSVVFSTSTFSDFKGVTIPTGRGDIDGILNYNFFGEDFNIVVNGPSDLRLDNPERCDPEFFDCTGPSGGGDVLFSENFEQFDAIEDYVAAGWTNVNVSGGSVVWIIGDFDGNNYAQISGFSSDEDEIETWLVTPSIDMDTTIEEELNFNLQAAFDNGLILTVLVSTNFTGDVTTADWSALDATIPVGPGSGFGDFLPAGPINVSCIDGTVNFAFLYEGSDPDATTRYHVDNIVLTGN